MRVIIGGSVQLAPDFDLAAVPAASVAETLQGKLPADFVQMRDDGTFDLNQANVENIFSAANYARLNDLLANGTLPNNGSNNISFGNQVVHGVSSPLAGTDAANRDYVDFNIGGKSASVSGVSNVAGDGMTLVWSQTNNRWEAGTPVATDATKLPLAGGSMTGSLFLGGNILGNVGQLGIGVSAPLSGTVADFNGIGTAYSSIIIPRDVTINRPAGVNGMIRYNTTLDKFEVFETGMWKNMVTSGGDFLSNGTVAMTGALRASMGLASAPSITFNNDSDSGFYSVANDQVGFSVGGSQKIQFYGPFMQGVPAGSFLMPFGTGIENGPTYSFNGDADTGIYQPSAGIIAFSTDGTEKLRLLSSGNLGVGTSVPAARLDVNGRIYVRPWGTAGGQAGAIALQELSANGGDLFTIRAPDGLPAPMGWTLPSAAPIAGQLLSSDAAGNLSWVSAPSGDFQSNGSVMMTGNFGAAAGTAVNPGITFAGDSNTGIFNAGSDGLGFSTGGAERLRVDPAGNVGIGTPSPVALLHLVGQANFFVYDQYGSPTGANIKLRAAGGTPGAPSSTVSGNSLGQFSFYGYGSGSFNPQPAARIAAISPENHSGATAAAMLSFQTRSSGLAPSNPPAERMLIDSNGNVGIGTSVMEGVLNVFAMGSGPTTVGHFAGNVSGGPADVVIQNTNPGNRSAEVVFMNNSAMRTWSVGTDMNSNGGNDFYIYNDFNSNAPFVISSMGFVGIGNPSPAAALHVNGAIVSTETVISSGSVADMSMANQVVFQNVGGASITLNNMVFGGQYRVIVEDTTSRTYTFGGCSSSSFIPANTLTAGGARTIYRITYSNLGKCYIDWTTGYN
jgi:hypothetical protein